MTVSPQAGAGALRVLAAAERPVKAWQLWLASRLTRAGFGVELVEAETTPATSSWQARETAGIEPLLASWFDRRALETESRTAPRREGDFDIAVCAGVDGPIPAARLGAVAIELAAYPDLTRTRARLRRWAPNGHGRELSDLGAAVIEPQVAPGDVFATVWLRLLVEACERAVAMVEGLARGVEPEGLRADPTVRQEPSWSEVAAYRSQGRGLRSPQVLRTGFSG